MKEKFSRDGREGFCARETNEIPGAFAPSLFLFLYYVHFLCTPKALNQPEFTSITICSISALSLDLLSTYTAIHCGLEPNRRADRRSASFGEI